MPCIISGTWLGVCGERLRWLTLLLPLIGVLWASVPADSFRILLELILTVTAAYLAGRLIGLIPRIPPLLGMMLAGATLKQFSLINLPPTLAAHLRSMALAIILLRGNETRMEVHNVHIPPHQDSIGKRKNVRLFVTFMINVYFLQKLALGWISPFSRN